MGVYVHGGRNVLVAEIFLRHLDVHPLLQHNRCTQVSEIMKPTLMNLPTWGS